MGIAMKNRVENKAKVDPWVDARTARLFEVSGHYGPWTLGEYVAAFGTHGGDEQPKPQPPADVVEAAEKEDLARIAFENAHARWAALKGEFHALTAKAPPTVISQRTGEILPDRKLERRIAKLERETDEAWEEREQASAALAKARTAYINQQKAWEVQRRIEEAQAARR